jgi:excisionase family DNA binding protein
MSEEKLLTIRDVALFLNISEREVMNFAEQGRIPAYKIAGVYLRFRKEQVEEFKKALSPEETASNRPSAYTVRERISDFFYFNDFYILSALVVLCVIFFIFH